MTEDEGTEEKSVFSSRNSYIDGPERFRVKVNDSQGKSVNLSKQTDTENIEKSKEFKLIFR